MYLGLFSNRAVVYCLPCCSESLCQAANSIHLCLGSWKCGRADRGCRLIPEAGGLLQGEGGLRLKRGFNKSPWKVVCVVRLHSFCFNTTWFSRLLLLWTGEWDTGAYGFVLVLFSAFCTDSLSMLCENCKWSVCIQAQTCMCDIKFVTRFLNYVLSLILPSSF